MTAQVPRISALLIVAAVCLLPTTGQATPEAGCGAQQSVGQGAQPSWSPDGIRIAFVRGTATWVVMAGGGRLRCLTHPQPNQADGSPAWDRAGRKIVFARFTSEAARGTSRLFIVNSDGTGTRLLSKMLPSFSIEPDWSPGRDIVFSGGCRLGVTSHDGTGLRLIRIDPVVCVSTPAWSRDTRAIAFSAVARRSTSATPAPSIWKVNRVGLRLVRLTHGANDRDPDWSPDGKRLVMSRSCRIAVFDTKTDVVVRFLTPSASANSPCARSPKWSPNGKEIAYSFGDSVYVMKADGSRKRRVA